MRLTECTVRGDSASLLTERCGIVAQTPQGAPRVPVVDGRADDFLIRIDGAATSDGRLERLGSLRDLLTVTVGQKIAYVTDVADTPANRAAIVALVQNADILFIEAAFAGADAALARERAHLTTTAAGVIAREANVRRVEPFHFSPRYAGEQERMLAEVMTAFQGSHA